MTRSVPSELQQYYDSYRAARARLERVSLGMEKLALEIATVQGHPNIGRYIQDRIRQLLCIHPEASLRYGAAESWCTICFAKIDPADLQLRAKEMMAHVVEWCKCDTSNCAVHHTVNDELPPPTIVVPAIPESRRAPQLSSVGDLVQLGKVEEQDDML